MSSESGRVGEDSLLVRTLFLAKRAMGSPCWSSSMAESGALTYIFLRWPGICVVASETAESAVFGRLSFLKKRERFLRTDLRFSARSSERMDSAMVDAAVRTVRRRRSGSMGASLSSSSWSGWTWRLKGDIVYSESSTEGSGNDHVCSRQCTVPRAHRYSQSEKGKRVHTMPLPRHSAQDTQCLP